MGNFQVDQNGSLTDGPNVSVGISTAARAKWFAVMDQVPANILRQVGQHRLRMLAEPCPLGRSGW